MAPDVVKVIYRNVDGVHVFTSEDMRGLYVAGLDLGTVYEEVAEALHDLLKYHGIDASYRPAMTTEQFMRFIGHLDTSIPHPSVIAARDVSYNRAV